MSDKNMGALQHLAELRASLINSLIGVGLGSVLCLIFIENLYPVLLIPIEGLLDSGLELIGTSPTEAFMAKLKLSLVFGIVISSPWVFLQIWHFVSPALHDNEKKFLIPFVIVSSCLFIVGVTFSLLVVLPYAFEFLISQFATISIEPKIKIGEYLSFCSRLMIIFGVIFELPIASFFLAKVGILKSKFLIDNFRYSVVGIFILSAILTPPDAITQVLLSLPLILIYGVCIIITKKFEK